MNHETIQPGTLLGAFEVQEELGAGSFGAVYAALVRTNGVRVAIKVLHPHLIHNKQALSRFIREAQTAAKLKHPHVVDILNIGHEGRYLFYCMEYLEGESLSALLHRMGALAVAEVVRLMIPVMAGVASIHDAGFVHRDLKPANIFLWKPTAGTIHPKILDFGVIKPLDMNEGQPLTNSQMALGTPHYMAPEQVRDSKGAGPACDQWALGVILYECLTGTRPFQGANAIEVLTRVLHSPVAPPRRVLSSLPEPLDAIVMRMLERDPARRYSSVREAGVALLEFADAGVRRRYGKEMGLQESFDTLLDADLDAQDPSEVSILAPGGSMEFLVPLEQIHAMRPAMQSTREFTPVDLRADRRRARPAALAWGFTVLALACVLGAWNFHTHASAQGRPPLVAEESTLQVPPPSQSPPPPARPPIQQPIQQPVQQPPTQPPPSAPVFQTPITSPPPPPARRDGRSAASTKQGPGRRTNENRRPIRPRCVPNDPFCNL